MKKILALFIVALGITAMSCKKDWTCKCTTTDGSGNTASSSTTIENKKKSDAEAECNDGDGSVGNYSTDCEIE